MTNSKLITPSPAEKLEDDALLAGEVVAGTLRAVEVAAVVLLGLLVCPPLAILVVLVVVPLLVIGARPRAPRGGRLDAVPARPPLPRAPSTATCRCSGIASAAPAGRSSTSLPHRIVADARRATPAGDRAAARRTCGRAATARRSRRRRSSCSSTSSTSSRSRSCRTRSSTTSPSPASRAPRSCCSSSGGRGSTRRGWPTGSTPPRRRSAGCSPAVMLASLLMAAALPEAFGEQALLFAASYVALQVGRNAAAAWLLHRRHRLRDVFERLVVWSAASGVLWLAGAALDSDQRLLLWIPALALDLAAPAAGYWLPGRGRAATTDYDIEGSALRRALPGLHHHRARRVDRRHRRDRIRGAGSHRRSCSASSSRSSRPRRCGGCTSARRPSTRAPR